VPIRRPGADVVLWLQIVGDQGKIVCGLRWLEGEITLRPKALRAAILEELEKIEALAKNAGCQEMRHSGDDRGAFLPDYEKMPELPNGRRKRLI
jgi:hypothetical protein